MSILKHFKGKPREVQIQALEQLEKNWNDFDVFVLSLPVGSGKSKIAQTIGKWTGKQTRILTPTNILVEQYVKDNAQLNSIKKKSSYICHTDRSEGIENAMRTTCEGYYKQFGEHCVACSYVCKVKAAKTAKIGVYNYYTYMALKLQSPIVIFDEAHKLEDTLKSLAAKRIWQHTHEYPNWVTTYGTLHKWVTGRLQQHPSPMLQELKDDLELNSTKYLVKRSMEELRGVERDCLSLIPIDVQHSKHSFWPKKVEKIILMSGTINFKDIEALGLAKRRVCYIDLPSPIPKENRPVIFTPVVSMAYATQTENLPILAQYILRMLDQHPTKGLIHITYNLAQKLQEHLDHPRLVWHDKENKMEQYRRFRESKDPVVMIASGLYEGIDLAGDDYQWQIITKIPFPSLAEPAIKFKAEKDSVWYHWETLKVLIQACGRICRGPDDSGTTYIVDTTWRKLFESAKKERLLTKEWLDAYQESNIVASEHETIRLPDGVEQGSEGRSVAVTSLPSAADSVPRPLRRFH